jgi:aspartyl-tRNA(Asn)/glutamyl-tRNA(Gln) amidotransferase subunit C
MRRLEQELDIEFRKAGNHMKITEDTVKYVAALAKLTVSEEEQQKVAADLRSILDYIETMNGLDTEGIEPMSHVLPVKNVFREDIVTNQDNREQLLKNAPKQKDGCFAVPKTVE